MKVIVFGATGMLGRDVIQALKSNPSYTVFGVSHGMVDITAPYVVNSFIERSNPAIVVNCAAYTNVDGCESNPNTVMRINGQGAGNLAKACREVGARLIQVSTDYVFDGTKKTPYIESDSPNPINIYGRSKLLGEELVKASGCSYVIARTQWLYGLQGANFVKTMLKMAGERSEIRVVTDQKGCPTYTVDLADAIKRIADKNLSGIYHVVNSGEATWYDFAKKIMEIADLPVKILQGTSKDIRRPARRPENSAISNSKFCFDAAYNMRRWEDALLDFMKVLGYGEGRVITGRPSGIWA